MSDPISVDGVDFIDGADNPIINTKCQVIELPIDLIGICVRDIPGDFTLSLIGL
jgi:hypothetical protein